MAPRSCGARCAASRRARAVEQHVLTKCYGDAVVADLVGRNWLQPPEELCREYLLTTAQIEVTAHCNWGCRFCPVSIDRKPAATMSIPLFEEIIRKISVYDTIRYVTFHFYNEPTLDRLFEKRLSILQEHGLVLRLFTNASHLTSDKINSLSRSGVLDRLVVNLPSVNEEEFQALTQSKTHAMSCAISRLPSKLVSPSPSRSMGREPTLDAASVNCARSTRRAASRSTLPSSRTEPGWLKGATTRRSALTVGSAAADGPSTTHISRSKARCLFAATTTTSARPSATFAPARCTRS